MKFLHLEEEFHGLSGEDAARLQGFMDTRLNGERCDYRTTAHDFGCYDYSTSFRCCADAR